MSASIIIKKKMKKVLFDINLFESGLLKTLNLHLKILM